MAKFRKKPMVIEAEQWTGSNFTDIEKFAPDLVVKNYDDTLSVSTVEGILTAQIADWIIRGVRGEFYPCKPDIFEETYEEVIE